MAGQFDIVNIGGRSAEQMIKKFWADLYRQLNECTSDNTITDEMSVGQLKEFAKTKMLN